jgi:hypothetical protein
MGRQAARPRPSIIRLHRFSTSVLTLTSVLSRHLIPFPYFESCRKFNYAEDHPDTLSPSRCPSTCPRNSTMPSCLHILASRTYGTFSLSNRALKAAVTLTPRATKTYAAWVARRSGCQRDTLEIAQASQGARAQNCQSNRSLISL